MKTIFIAIMIAVSTIAFADEQKPEKDACKYSVSEIDDLRSALSDRYIWGTSCMNKMNGISRAYKKDEKNSTVELQLRTFMMACIKAESIIDADCK